MGPSAAKSAGARRELQEKTNRLERKLAINFAPKTDGDHDDLQARAVSRSQRVDRESRMKGFHACFLGGARRTGTVRGPGQAAHSLPPFLVTPFA